MDVSAYHVVASAHAPTLPGASRPYPVERPGDRPGIVIFLHGVNDPGATYENVERGLNEGLNWRLNRRDLASGTYGMAWQLAKDAETRARSAGSIPSEDVNAVIEDPDSYLYRRTEVERETNSVFIPFYWGYRASDQEIAKDQDGNPIRLRGQYQDIRDNRLDAHFAKEGGFFDNATNNIPDMYGAGFSGNFKSDLANWLADDYTFIGDSPERLYFVLAAQRLAMLIREIRVANAGQGTADETITVIGHSQGTIIGLLAQAILAEDGGDSRPADTLIMVDSPYAVWENGEEQQTSQAKLATLGNIVKAVTAARHTGPALAELHGERRNGRTGPRWTPRQGVRPLGAQGADTPFVERDNRGKVYLYFCTDDQVVALSNVAGIGTFGLPDKVQAKAQGSTSWFSPDTIDLPAMSAFRAAPQTYAFHQRLWSKLRRAGQPMLVGLPPAEVPLRSPVEGRHAGSGITAEVSQASFYEVKDIRDGGRLEGRYGDDLKRWINGEAIDPPWTPRLQGGETLDAGHHPSGKLPVDAVAVTVALGNRRATEFRWIPMPKTADPWTGGPPNGQVLTQEFNRGKPLGDQTRQVRVNYKYGRGGDISDYDIDREETPNEAQARLAGQDATDNSYHSAILNDVGNIRAVVAMDVAIGQAKTLDDPDWRRLLLAIADWRTDWRKGSVDSELLRLRKRLTDHGRRLVDATSGYYYQGIFPGPDLVPRTWPGLVKSQTKAERAERRNDPGMIA